MREHRLSLQILLFLLFVGLYISGTVSAGFQEGLAAFEREEYEIALREFKASADQGHAEAHFYLGVVHSRGLGVIKNVREAEKWIRRSAEQGSASGQVGLAHIYYNAKDYGEAMRLYRKAAEQGYVAGQFCLAGMFARGEGVSKDYTEAAKWYSKAAEQGDPASQYVLGIMYSKGHGVAKNSLMSYKLTILAALHGNKEARTLAAKMILFIIVSIIFHVSVLRFATKLNADFKPSFKAAFGIEVAAMAALFIVYDALLSFGFSTVAVMQSMLTGAPRYISRMVVDFFLSAVIYARLLKHPDSGNIGFKSACYVSLATTSVVIALTVVIVVFSIIFSMSSLTRG